MSITKTRIYLTGRELADHALSIEGRLPHSAALMPDHFAPIP